MKYPNDFRRLNYFNSFKECRSNTFIVNSSNTRLSAARFLNFVKDGMNEYQFEWRDKIYLCISLLRSGGENMLSLINSIEWPSNEQKKYLTDHQFVLAGRILRVYNLLSKSFCARKEMCPREDGIILLVSLSVNKNSQEDKLIDNMGIRESLSRLHIRFAIRDSNSLEILNVESHKCDILTGESIELKYKFKRGDIPIRIEATTPLGIHSMFSLGTD